MLLTLAAVVGYTSLNRVAVELEAAIWHGYVAWLCDMAIWHGYVAWYGMAWHGMAMCPGYMAWLCALAVGLRCRVQVQM